ncbi:hypothetical protein ACA910_015028 [Epithemia clementina (nom. ined.)]
MSEDRDITPPASEEMEDSAHITPDSGTAQDFSNETTKDPSPNDVLCGRGGSINSHPGNERFRTLVEKRKRVYLTARFKREKRLIASSIVSEIRNLDPPGRFLQQDKKTGLWRDIGDEKARDKTSQALRENAPTIRAEIETEINEQRAELKKEEQEHVNTASHMPLQPSPSYYQGGWGPSYHSYYGYSHHAPHPPLPPPPHHHHSHAGYYPPPPHHESHWGYYPPPHHHPGHPHAHHPHAPPPPKSTFEQTAEYIASSAESLKRWTEESLSLGGGSVTGGGGSVGHGSHHSHHSRHSHHSHSGDEHDVHGMSGGSVGSATSKPLSYVHNDDSKKRRMVKFRSDTKRSMRRMGSGHMDAHPSSRSVMSGNSLVDSSPGHDIEPQSLDEEQNSTLMTQVASQILGSLGSWDAGSILCGNDTVERPKPSYPRVASRQQDLHQPSQEQDDEMAVEWEGQEVQLLDRSGNENGSVASEERMPPPPRHAIPDQQSSVGYSSVAFSSLGSCHSWLPVSEQFSTAASYFSGRGEEGSMDMEGAGSVLDNQSGMMGDHSATGSIGGASLTRVFENEAMPDAPTSMMQEVSAHQGHRVLASMPSWERSLRSRSPLSIESDDEDVSLISKESSKLSAENFFGTQPQSQQPEQNGMVWEQKE